MSETNPFDYFEPRPEPEVGEVMPYELLKGHYRTDGSYKTDEQLRTEYIHRTDELIRKMTEGVTVTDPETGERKTEIPDFVVYLDKSARPVSWLVRELWPKLAAAPGQDLPSMPKTRFVNIDREQWVNTVDPHGLGKMNIDLVDKSVVRSLRSIFTGVAEKRNGLEDNIDTAPTELDGKTVLVVDEVHSSGRTLDIAEKFFKRAFPTAKIATSYWMGGVTQKNGAQGNADLPVWYKEKDATGRGVDNRDEGKSQLSNSVTQRLGGWFLSTAFKEADPLSLRLRQEIKQLANDPAVLKVPSYQRDDLDARATALNHMTWDEFVAAKNKLDKA